MIGQKYFCDLCKYSQDVTVVIGLHWLGKQEGWAERALGECRNHICTDCLSALASIRDERELKAVMEPGTGPSKHVLDWQTVPPADNVDAIVEAETNRMQENNES